MPRDIGGLIDDSLDEAGRSVAREFERDVEEAAPPGAFAVVHVVGATSVLMRWIENGARTAWRRVTRAASRSRAPLGLRLTSRQRRL